MFSLVSENINLKIIDIKKNKSKEVYYFKVIVELENLSSKTIEYPSYDVLYTFLRSCNSILSNNEKMFYFLDSHKNCIEGPFCDENMMGYDVYFDKKGRLVKTYTHDIFSKQFMNHASERSEKEMKYEKRQLPPLQKNIFPLYIMIGYCGEEKLPDFKYLQLKWNINGVIVSDTISLK